jgi:hypothetical protein
MTLPVTDIGLNKIFMEANGIDPPSFGTTASMFELSRNSYFDGPNGSSITPINAWGLTSAGGLNRIWRTPFVAPSNPYKFSYYQDLEYFYDNTSGGNTYDTEVYLEASNNCPPPNVPPDPPDVFDFNCSLEFFDNSYTYRYLGQGFQLFQGGFNPQWSQDIIPRPQTIPQIRTYYWAATITTTPGYPGTNGNRTFTLKCNGTNYVNVVTINNGTNIFLGATYGYPIMSQTTTNPYISPVTGSYWQFDIN